MNTSAARAKAWARINILLASVRCPHQFQLEPGGMQRMPGDRAIEYWFNGESEKAKTLGNVMVTHTVQIRAVWRVPATDDIRVRTALELEIWDTTRAIQEALHGDSDLAEWVTRIDFGNATRIDSEMIGTGVETVPVTIIDLPLYIQELEAERVAA